MSNYALSANAEWTTASMLAKVKTALQEQLNSAVDSPIKEETIAKLNHMQKVLMYARDVKVERHVIVSVDEQTNIEVYSPCDCICGRLVKDYLRYVAK